MSETASDLVDRVLPRVPVRQWVLTMPWELRFRLAKDAKLLSGALGIFVSEVFRHLRRKSGIRPARGVQCGAVTAVQRFGSAMNLNCHYHTIALDGVYVRDPAMGELGFRKLPAPSKEELEEVLRRTVKRIFAFLERKGCVVPRRGEATRAEEYDPAAVETSAMDILQAALALPKRHTEGAKAGRSGNGSGFRTRRERCPTWGGRRRGRGGCRRTRSPSAWRRRGSRCTRGCG